jgi:DNA-binding response OmpR family regulator
MMSETQYYQKKIMIVDDDPDITSSLLELLENQGFQVITVENGQECLDELHNGFQGIIILDLMMPIMDGIETIKHMNTNGYTANNTIIVLTAKAILQKDEFDEIYPYLYDYITKPFDINLLVEVIKKIALQPPRINNI